MVYILGAVVMELGTKTPCTRTEYAIHSPASQREEVAAALREYRGILTRKMLKKARDADEPIVLRATCYSGARFATCRLVAPEQRRNPRSPLKCCDVSKRPVPASARRRRPEHSRQGRVGAASMRALAPLWRQCLRI